MAKAASLSRKRFREGEVQLQDIYARLAKNPQAAGRHILLYKSRNSLGRRTACLGDTRHLKQSVSRRVMASRR